MLKASWILQAAPCAAAPELLPKKIKIKASEELYRLPPPRFFRICSSVLHPPMITPHFRAISAPPCRHCKKACLLLLLSLCCTSQSHAHEISFSGLQVEETDSIFKDGLGARYAFTPKYSVQMSYWGRSFAEVRQTHLLLSAFRSLYPTTKLRFEIKLGGSFLYESTTIKADKTDKLQDTQWNIGALLGLDLAVLSYKKFSLHALWDSSLFPSGLTVILGITGRKQQLGLRIAYRIGSTSQSQEGRQKQKIQPWHLPTLSDVLLQRLR